VGSCIGNKGACPFPEVRDNLCSQHLRDRDTGSPFGTGFPTPNPHGPLAVHVHDVVEPRRAGNNHLKEEKRKSVVDALMSSLSTRQVCDKTGVAKRTILKIRTEISSQLPKCQCGRENGHRGMCRNRLARPRVETEKVRGIIPRGERLTMPEIRAILNEEKTDLLAKIAEIDLEIETLDKVVAIADRLRR
jgi:hypothetical protein